MLAPYFRKVAYLNDLIMEKGKNTLYFSFVTMWSQNVSLIKVALLKSYYQGDKPLCSKADELTKKDCLKSVKLKNLNNFPKDRVRFPCNHDEYAISKTNCAVWTERKVNTKLF